MQEGICVKYLCKLNGVAMATWKLAVVTAVQYLQKAFLNYCLILNILLRVDFNNLVLFKSLFSRFVQNAGHLCLSVG